VAIVSDLPDVGVMIWLQIVWFKESGVRFLYLVFLAVWAVSSAAVEVKDLYVSEVEVASQSPEDRNGAIRLALADILVKVTGRRDIRSEAAIQELIKSGPRYVRQYSYREDGVASGESPQRKLLVRFDSFALNEALNAAGIEVWSEERPSILAWVAVDGGAKRYLLESENHPRLTAFFQKAAEKRGLPLLLPLMDLVDQSAISFNDIWGNFDDRIAQASTRYGADTILSGRLLKKSGSRWQVEWTLYQQGDVAHWRDEAKSASEALALGIDGTFDLLAERYVIGAAQKEIEQYELRVSGIKGLDDFVWLTNRIKALSLIETVEWRELSGESAQLSLTIKGDKQALRRALDSVERLFLITSDAEDQEGELFYQIRP